MKYIKKFEGDGDGLIKPKEERISALERWKKLLGKLFRIYPNRNPKEMIVIAKLDKIIGINNSWGEYSGYVIHPKSAEGHDFNGSEYISDWESEIPTDEEVKFYTYCDKLKKFNI